MGGTNLGIADALFRFVPNHHVSDMSRFADMSGYVSVPRHDVLIESIYEIKVFICKYRQDAAVRDSFLAVTRR